MKTHRRPAPSGFTLVELLTVIAIVGILAGLMICVLGRMRTGAHQAACVSNLRQVHTAIMGYANDHKGWLPDVAVHPGSTWQQWWLVVAPYIGNPSTTSSIPVHKILQCPEVALLGDQLMTRADRMLLPNYGYNELLGRSSNDNGVITKNNRVQINAVRNPTRTILAGDNGMGTTGPLAALTPDRVALQGDKHPEGSSLLWIDGHVSLWKNITRLGADPYRAGGTQDAWTP